MEINTTHFAHLGQRMLDMRAVIKARQVADEPDTPDWPPTYEFDQAVINFGRGSDHHSPASKFAVIECEEQTRPPIDFTFTVDGKRKRSAPKTRKAEKNSRLVPDFAPVTETPRT